MFKAINRKNFKCQRCGNCCKVPGYVILKPHEIESIAAFLNMEVEEFTARYTRLTYDRKALSLTEREDGACIFLTPENYCTIQPVKPEQCRNFPFVWRTSILEQCCPAISSFQ